MLKTPKLIAGAIAAAFLAACSSTGTSTLPSSSSPDLARPPMNSPFWVRGENGQMMHVFPTRERMHAFARGSSGTSNLIWHNGPVQHPASVYLVFWGNWQSGGDPNGAAARLTAFFNGVGGSQWDASTTQYTDSTGGVGNVSGALKGTWYDTSSVPRRPSQSNVAAEAARAAAHFGVYSSNTSFFVAMPTGHDPSGFKTQWCAFHSTTSTSGGTISYTDFPYSTDAGASCGQGSVNSGSAGTLDGFTIVGGHEYAETETDPQPNSGWLDSSGAENGDKCAWTGLQNTSFSTGSFPTQPLWSNSAKGCVQ